MTKTRAFAAALAAVVVAASGSLAQPMVQGPVTRVDQALGLDKPPNVLIIITDDHRLQGTMAALPETRDRIGGRGVFYPRAVANTPLCCPARATIMTGRYTHNHDVIDNKSAEKLRTSKTLQARLRKVGYHTAIFGKYFNHMTSKPPHFERYFIFGGPPKFENSEWNDQGNYGLVKGYSTDLIGNKAIDHLESLETAADDQPWFFILAPIAPHAPYAPADRHQGDDVPRWRTVPSLKERNRSDKLDYVRKESADPTLVKRIVRRQLRTLFAVDEMVVKVDKALRQLDERGDTIVVFMGDNGYSWGDHGMFGPAISKNHPYRSSVSIPLMMRWPGHLEDRGKSRRLAGLVDVAPTVHDAVGLRRSHLDGKSLLVDQFDRKWQFLEHHNTPDTPPIPTWASLRNKNVHFTEYFRHGKVIFREYYDLKKDPWENQNLFHDGRPRNDPKVGKLHRLLVRLRKCEGRVGQDRCI